MVSKLKFFTFFVLTFSAFTNFNAQVANFTITSPSSFCGQGTVVFQNTSTGMTSFLWNFGDGNTSTTITNPSENYLTTGTYTVTLTINGGVSSKTAVVNIYKKPVANFSISDTNGCLPFSIDFTDLSTIGDATINAWNWDFDDGGGISMQNPSHSYGLSGVYNPKLTVIDLNNCSNTKNISINVSSTTLTAVSVPSSTVACSAPAIVAFDGSSSTSSAPGAINFSWDFGDGSALSTLPAPSHTFASSGTYTVTLTTTSSVCTKTTTSSVTVLGNSTPAFITIPDSICPGGTLTFSDQTTPVPTAWIWDFADPGSGVLNTSTAQGPSHLYSAAGIYMVKLTVGYVGICFNNVTQPVTVSKKPTVNFAADTTFHCRIPFTVDFTDNTIASNGTIASWLWNFGDGQTSTSPNPSHQYTSSGIYTVKLYITTAAGCLDSMVKINYITLQPIVAGFAPNPDRGCVPLTSSFVDATSNHPGIPITSYTWTFGDGKNAATQNTVNTYSFVGTYTATHTVTNSYGCTSTSTALVFVTNPPVPNFSVSTTASCALSTVQFTDLTTDTVTSWEWDFGDPISGGFNSSSLQNPTHAFQDTGYFNVRLISKNIGCPDTIIVDSVIHIAPAVPRFTVGVNCTNVLQRTFISNSLGADSLIWNFGDGSALNANISSLNSSPSHTYALPGSYTVKLTAKNQSSGCRRDTSQIVTIVDLKPQFTLSNPIGCNALTVNNYTDQTTGGAVTGWLWSFGDGSAGAATPNVVSHVYNTMGKKTVKLYVFDIYGCRDSIVKVDTVNVLTIAPNLAINSAVGCDSLLVTFDETSTVSPAATSWTINWGDGKTSSGVGPTPVQYTHYYTTSGTYSIDYRITNAEGFCSTIKTNFVSFVKTSAAFTVPAFACPDAPVSITTNNSQNALTYLWNFGDPASGINNTSTATTPSHTYSTNGVYTVTLTATNPPCSNSTTSTITIDKPNAQFTVSGFALNCPPLVDTLTDASTSVSAINSYIWSFGDASPGSVLQNPIHTYINPGTYSVKLYIGNTAGCKDTSSTTLVTVNGPTGSFVMNPDTGCVPLNVNFMTTVSLNTDSIKWTFGDGDTSTVKSPTHTYISPGIYQPKLTLIDLAGCKWSDTTKFYVKVNSYPFPNFTYTPQYPKPGEVVSLTDGSVIATSWVWDFGNGATSNAQNPTTVYNSSGIYTIKLIVNNSGCADSVKKLITVIEDLVIPNIFSPNGDGKNDTFNAGAYGISNISIQIFDRWGIKVFAKEAQRIYWDGHTTSGATATDGTYYYIITATSIGGEVLPPYKGFIQLIR